MESLDQIGQLSIILEELISFDQAFPQETHNCHGIELRTDGFVGDLLDEHS